MGYPLHNHHSENGKKDADLQRNLKKEFTAEMGFMGFKSVR